MPLRIVRNDITRMKVDAIVTSTNEELRAGGTGVDADVRYAAGPRLEAALETIGHCDMGSAVITEAFDLHGCRWIIHAVGPVYIDGSCGEREMLEQCYRSVLELAHEHRCRSLAVPLISSGAYGYPKAEAYAVATSCIREFLLSLPGLEDMDISLVLFDSDAVAVSEKIDPDIRHMISDAYPLEKAARPHPLYASAPEASYRARPSRRELAAAEELRRGADAVPKARRSVLANILPDRSGDYSKKAEKKKKPEPESPEEKAPASQAAGSVPPPQEQAASPQKPGDRTGVFKIPAELLELEKRYSIIADADREAEASEEMLSFAAEDACIDSEFLAISCEPEAPLSVSEADYRDVDLSFGEMCEWWCKRKGLSKGEFYVKANISRAMFWSIRHRREQVPKKTSALACAIGLRLDYEQTQDLLARAGLTLSRYYALDGIVSAFIRKKNFDVDEINITLFEHDLSLLGCS